MNEHWIIIWSKQYHRNDTIINDRKPKRITDKLFYSFLTQTGCLSVKNTDVEVSLGDLYV